MQMPEKEASPAHTQLSVCSSGFRGNTYSNNNSFKRHLSVSIAWIATDYLWVNKEASSAPLMAPRSSFQPAAERTRRNALSTSVTIKKQLRPSTIRERSHRASGSSHLDATGPKIARLYLRLRLIRLCRNDQLDLHILVSTMMCAEYCIGLHVMFAGWLVGPRIGDWDRGFGEG